MTRRILATIAAALLAGVVLTGCGHRDPDPQPTGFPTVAPTTPNGNPSPTCNMWDPKCGGGTATTPTRSQSPSPSPSRSNPPGDTNDA